MEQFLVGSDGLLSELAALEQAAWFRTHTPGIDPVDFEAHFMLIRGFEAVKSEAPFEKHGIVSKSRFGILRLLYQADDNRMIMTDIVQKMNVSPTNITKLVDGLERANYVRRVDNEHDKRRVWVELLPEGRNAVETMVPTVATHIHSLWSGLNTEEKRVLIHLLAKLRLHILTSTANGNTPWREPAHEAMEASA